MTFWAKIEKNIARNLNLGTSFVDAEGAFSAAFVKGTMQIIIAQTKCWGWGRYECYSHHCLHSVYLPLQHWRSNSKRSNQPKIIYIRNGLAVTSCHFILKIVNICSRLVGTKLKDLGELYTRALRRKGLSILSDRSHPLNDKFQYLPSGRRLRVPRARKKYI